MLVFRHAVEESLTNPSHYERDLQILKVVESFANLSKKPNIPLGGVTSTSVIGLTSLPSVRVSTLTSHSSSPAMEVDTAGSLFGRPKSISPISPNPISDQGALRVLQSDVSTLKEVSPILDHVWKRLFELTLRHAPTL